MTIHAYASLARDDGIRVATSAKISIISTTPIFMKRMITGIKPTGAFPHIGNLLGAMLPLRDNASKYDTALFIPDLHALTTIKDGKTLKENTRNALISYLAVLGPDTKVTIFRQSDIVGIPKLAWILSCFTPYSLMMRAHTFKDAENKKEDLNMGTFNYPILMAADILGYDIDVVPVGKDQLQHLEMARDIARYVNHHFKAEIFIEPKPIIDDAVATIIGTDGRKMSKSYNNTISMFESSADLKKKIATIPTDDKKLEDVKNPDTCNVFAMIKMFGTHDEIETIRAKYLAGGYGY
jgi:tryptophanyl-tRNA synthetase